MTEEERARISDLVRERSEVFRRFLGDQALVAADEDFLRAARIDRQGASSRGRELLHEGNAARDPVCVECGLTLGFVFGVTADYLDALVALGAATWHHSHEDVVDALEPLKAPAAIEVLHQLALTAFPYRDWDDTSGLARKCVWALSKIDSTSAIERLGDLRAHPHETVRWTVIERLHDLADKAPTAELREAARGVLAVPLAGD